MRFAAISSAGRIPQAGDSGKNLLKLPASATFGTAKLAALRAKLSTLPAKLSTWTAKLSTRTAKLATLAPKLAALASKL
jgi:hypothetical protein